MKSNKVSVSLVEHRGEQRLKIEYQGSFNLFIDNIIRKIEGRKWSRTMGCWHIPHTMNAYEQLSVQLEVELNEQGRTSHLVAPSSQASPHSEVTVERYGNGWLKVSINPPDKIWEQRISKLRGSFKDELEDFWVVPSDRATRNQLESLLSTQIKLKTIPKATRSEKPKPPKLFPLRTTSPEPFRSP